MYTNKPLLLRFHNMPFSNKQLFSFCDYRHMPRFITRKKLDIRDKTCIINVVFKFSNRGEFYKEGRNQNSISYYLFFFKSSFGIYLQWHFVKFQNHPPGELREHYQGEVTRKFGIQV